MLILVKIDIRKMEILEIKRMRFTMAGKSVNLEDLTVLNVHSYNTQRKHTRSTDKSGEAYKSMLRL